MNRHGIEYFVDKVANTATEWAEWYAAHVQTKFPGIDAAAHRKQKQKFTAILQKLHPADRFFFVYFFGEVGCIPLSAASKRLQTSRVRSLHAHAGKFPHR